MFATSFCPLYHLLINFFQSIKMHDFPLCMTFTPLVTRICLFILWAVAGSQGERHLLKPASVSSHFGLMVSAQADRFANFVFLLFSFLSFFMFQILLLSLAMKVMLEQAQSNVCYWVGKRRTNIFCLSFFANNWHIWWEKCLRLYFVIILICCNAIYCCEFIQDNNTSLLYLNTHKLSLDLNF